MTIPKRDKKRRRGEKSPAYPPADKMVEAPVIDRMLRTPMGTPFPFYTRVCPYCGQGSLSTICQKCGRLTIFKSKVSTK